MNKIGPGIAKIQPNTFAAGISACPSTGISYCIRRGNINIGSSKSIDLRKAEFLLTQITF
jgi:hypothetical protein